MITNFAQRYQENGHNVAARFLLTANAAINHSSAEAHYLLAELLLNTRQIASAKKHITKAIALGNSSGEQTDRYEQLNEQLKSILY